MIELHCALNFSTSPYTHQKVVIYPADILNNHEKHKDNMISFARSFLPIAIKDWGEKMEDLIKVEFYFIKDGGEVVFFEWSREEKKG